MSFHPITSGPGEGLSRVIPASLSFDPLRTISLAWHPRQPFFQPPVLTLLTLAADCGPYKLSLGQSRLDFPLFFCFFFSSIGGFFCCFFFLRPAQDSHLVLSHSEKGERGIIGAKQAHPRGGHLPSGWISALWKYLSCR